ncbi:MAG: alpha/beta fold hydrolase [Candidatus Nitrosotenuis sp.]|nr:MAG: alpha/beta fold hydrolase [Candidatus Nitrosotenuis sp.]
MSQINHSDNKHKIIPSTYYDYWYAWYDFVLKYNDAFFESAVKSVESLFNVGDGRVGKIQNVMRAAFDSTLQQKINEEGFATSVANLVSARIKLARLFGYDKIYNNLADFFLAGSRTLEPIRDNINRTPSEVISTKGRFSLLHYKPIVEQKHKTPLLVVYSLINRHYILDLLPKVSVINSLLKQGFDVYATDWGTPDSSYQNMTLENYAHEYVENAVEKIKEITGSEKVSLFGYCWGGIFALIHSAIHPENVKNLILHATPMDLGQTNTVIENWTKHIDADELVNTFGNIPGWFLNAAFIMRNPVEALLKYWRYFSEPKSLDEVRQFFAIEIWLYDSVPIIGPVYKEIVNQIYKKNLLIKNKMRVGSDLVDLRKITMPVLNIIGTKDDLVPPDSSRSIMNAISSTDKKLIEFPTGHVGLCVSADAHEKLWPEVGKWLTERS